MKANTTISITRRTRHSLNRIGRRGESFDKVIRRMIRERKPAWQNEKTGLWAYIAGFMDGEGTVRVEPNPSSIKSPFNLKIAMKQHLGGLVDGEGCFRVKYDKRKTTNYRKSDKKFHPEFCIELKETKKLFTGLSNYLAKNGIENSIYSGGKNWTLSISSLYYVERFLRFIFPYTILKQKQIEIMLEIIKDIKKYRGCWNKRRIIKVMCKIDRMNALKGGRRGKYNANYLRKKWGFKTKRLLDRRPQIEKYKQVAV